MLSFPSSPFLFSRYQILNRPFVLWYHTPKGFHYFTPEACVFPGITRPSRRPLLHQIDPPIWRLIGSATLSLRLSPACQLLLPVPVESAWNWTCGTFRHFWSLGQGEGHKIPSISPSRTFPLSPSSLPPSSPSVLALSHLLLPELSDPCTGLIHRRACTGSESGKD